MAPTSPRKRTPLRKTSVTPARERHAATTPQWPWHRLRWNERQIRLALLGILIVGAFFRSTGRDWDAGTGLHPDERFFSMVATDLRPLSPGVSYFDTARSTLNPTLKPDVWYVYGTLPLFLTHWLNGIRGENSPESMMMTGRWLSTLADLGTVALTFLLGRWWYGTAVGLGAAALFACAWLPIQLCHFFPVDPFCAFFVTLAMAALTGVRLPRPRKERFDARSFALWSGAFAVAAGLAAASKIYGALILFAYLPAAWLRWQQLRPRRDAENAGVAFHLWLAVAAMAFLVFRVAQPYAFSGPGFFDLTFSQKWIGDLQRQFSYSSEVGTYPPTIQWLNRPPTFALENLLTWGFAPLGGFCALVGLIGMGVRLFRDREWGHAPHWLWTVGYFLAFGVASHTPMQRYLLPIYPMLAIAAAWLFGQLWQLAGRASDPARAELARRAVAVTALMVLVTSLLAGGALTAIYHRPVTRLAATEWLLHQAPGPINVGLESMYGPRRVPLPFPYNQQLTTERPYRVTFVAHTAGEAKEILLPHLMPAGATGEVAFTVKLYDTADAGEAHGFAATAATAAATAATAAAAATAANGELTLKLPSEQSVTITLQPTLRIQRNREYAVELATTKPNLVFRLEGTRIAHETGWDDQLPVRWSGVEDIGPIDPYGGIYPTDLDLNAYEPDNRNKLERVVQVLERAELLTLSSQRQWATLTRLPNRYPVMMRFYQKLIGCPSGTLIADCYARPAKYELHPELGYRLLQDFRSFPSLGPLQFLDTQVEEALTVYDHPPVMIFRNDERRSAAQLRQILDGPMLP